MNRSEFLKSIGIGAALCYANPWLAKALKDPEFSRALFGESFLWGAAISAYQSEGAWNIDGKGESIWDKFSNRGKIKDNSTGNVASDFYHRYGDDLRLLKELNFKNFRFSFSWSRLLPEGTGSVNIKGVDFYNRVIDQCLELGIEPWTTLYHWDLPQLLEDKGGWTNRDILSWFSEYTQLCTKKFGDRIHHWLVLNEPMAFTSLGYFIGMHAPGRIGINSFLAAIHHATLCQ